MPAKRLICSSVGSLGSFVRLSAEDLRNGDAGSSPGIPG